MPETTSNQILKDMMDLYPTPIDLSLERVYDLLEKLGNPQKRVKPVIHVAGTNGKGSVLAFIKQMLLEHGDKVQHFTSPHLLRFHERIQLASNAGTFPISEEALVETLTRAHLANGTGPITFFEITTAAAFLAFSENETDWCLLETGLGGRLDATNVVDDPALTIITPISFDHQRFLGNELKEIAFEKAGILKPGVWSVIGEQPDEALDVIRARAEEIGAPLLVAGEDYDVYRQRGRLIYQSRDELIDLPLPRNLMGRHQIENAGLAITAVRKLLGERLDLKALGDAMDKTRWPARMQRLRARDFSPDLIAGDELWLDGGHNPAAGAVLAECVGDLEERLPRPLHLIVGMMAGKDARGFLHQFMGLASLIIAVPIPGENGAMNPDDLCDLAIEMGFEAESASCLDEALLMSAAGRLDEARILICGSLYLAGHVLGSKGAQLNEAL